MSNNQWPGSYQPQGGYPQQPQQPQPGYPQQPSRATHNNPSNRSRGTGSRLRGLDTSSRGTRNPATGNLVPATNNNPVMDSLAMGNLATDNSLMAPAPPGTGSPARACLRRRTTTA